MEAVNKINNGKMDEKPSPINKLIMMQITEIKKAVAQVTSNILCSMEICLKFLM